MDQYSQIVSMIIKDQEMIIGPVALEQARKVSGLEVTTADNVKVVGIGKEVLEDLIEQYAHLFGRASIEVCREAAKGLLTKMPKDQLPAILQ